MRTRPARRGVRIAVTLGLLAPLVATSAIAASAAPPDATTDSRHGRTHDRTSRQEALRVDRVPTPDPGWADCSAELGAGAECGRVALPLDYDEPDGATTEVALVRFAATDPDARLGSVFVNPGGPGGSGVELASRLAARGVALREQLDLVGFDPRGTNASTNVRCFGSQAARDAAVAPDLPPFPTGAEETAAFAAAAEALGRACSTDGAPLAGSVSTAQVARDLDVLRRAVGDERLTFLGFSYGSYLGNVYANMFPDRVRAIAVDGVVDPHEWRGDGRLASEPVALRTGAHEAHRRALDELLERCGAAGAERCRTAGLGDPREVYDGVVAGLEAAPVDLADPETGEVVAAVTYPHLVVILQGFLSQRGGVNVPHLDQLVWSLDRLQQAPTPELAPEQAEAMGFLLAFVSADEAPADPQAYDNDDDVQRAVTCTDGNHPRRVGRFAAAAERADDDAPGFGPLLAWHSAACATTSWTARDEDAYRGSFDHRTAAPVLVVGNHWDPSTPFDGAEAVAAELPRARLLESDSWGHAAYGTSDCVTDAVDRYLRTVELPAEGTVCVGDLQPFTRPWPEALAG